MADLARVREVDAADLDRHLDGATTPFVVRGLVADWPLVQAGKRSARAAREYLLQHRRDVAFAVAVGSPGGDGRLFYDAGMAMNFREARAKLPDIFARIDASEGRADAAPIYVGSAAIDDHFDGLHAANHVDLGARSPIASIWIGTRSRVAAHNDTPDNLACVAVGRRRFTIFPRDQFANLYLGPVDNTPAGRAISMVDFHDPDLTRHPRFGEALAHAQVAELEAGDAVFVPALWWHHVEGLSDFNVLVNYWWRDTPRWMAQAQDAMLHAILAIRDLPADQKAHWRAMFDHYVFGDADAAAAHIPAAARSVLAPLTPDTAARIRGFLLQQLSR